VRGRSPKAVELPQVSAEAQRSSQVRTRASDGALQLQERTAQTICSLPTIARPDTFPVNLAGRGLYVRTLHGESQLFPFTMLLPSLSPLITVTFSTPTRCYTKRRATLDWSTITEVGPAFQKDHIKMVAGEVMRLPAALISRTAAPDLLVR
jgi:hypothetical protein